MESKGRVSGPFGAAARLGVPSSTLESKIKAFKSTSGVSSRPRIGSSVFVTLRYREVDKAGQVSSDRKPCPYFHTTRDTTPREL